MILCNSQFVIPISLLLHFFQIINCSNGTIAVFAPYLRRTSLLLTLYKLQKENFSNLKLKNSKLLLSTISPPDLIDFGNRQRALSI